MECGSLLPHAGACSSIHNPQKVRAMSRKIRAFDYVEMKRRIQEGIYEETKNMTHEELLEYFHKRIANSRFSSFLQQEESPQRAE